jgi:hypothetical protein
MTGRFQMPSLRDEIAVTVASGAFTSAVINCGGQEPYSFRLPVMSGVTVTAPTFTTGFDVYTNAAYTQLQTANGTFVTVSVTTAGGVYTFSDTLRAQLGAFQKMKMKCVAADGTTGASQFNPRTVYWQTAR